MKQHDVAVAGSGFGGSILARALRARGLDVLLLERRRHPRFTLGESSTPLAALSLERLARDHGLADLHALAAYGRWRARYPGLSRGLKRGFTFWDARRASPERSCLMVAASPDDRVADAHWLRADVDAHLVSRAVAEGVDYRERCEVVDLSIDDGGVDLELAEARTRRKARAGVLVDATGRGGLVRRALGVAAGDPVRTRSSLLYGHFRDVAPQAGPSAPYPAEWAAVHHLLDEGWMYELRFDDGLVSAGLCLTEPVDGDAGRAWQAILERYPPLRAAYAGAEPLFPVRHVPALQHRLARAAGPRWVALPHTYAFVDPLFSTGIAWTLLAVERLAGLLGGDASGEAIADGTAFRRYARLLERESAQIDGLVAGAYRAMSRFELFAVYALAYFAAVSWAEARQRLVEPPSPAWEAFLGCDDEVLATLFAEAEARLPAGAGEDDAGAYRRWLTDRVAARDVAGLDRFAESLRVPVDLDVLVERAALLGLDRAAIVERLPRLRGDVPG